MKRHHTLALLLLASVAGGLWLLRPSKLADAPVEEATGACEQESACSTIVSSRGADPAEGTSAPPIDPAPAPPAAGSVPAPSTAAPPSRATGEDPREKADRLLAEGKVHEGLDAMREAVEADPSARNYGDLGAMLERLTAFDEAARNLQKAAELDPTNADRWIALANVNYRKVDLGEAWKAERRAREAEPGLVLGRDANGMRIRQENAAE